MKNQRFRLYINWGLTALAVIACSVFLAFSLMKVQTIFGVIGEIIQILMPIIYGGVLSIIRSISLSAVIRKSCLPQKKSEAEREKQQLQLPVCCFCLYWSAAWSG